MGLTDVMLIVTTRLGWRVHFSPVPPPPSTFASSPPHIADAKNMTGDDYQPTTWHRKHEHDTKWRWMATGQGQGVRCTRYAFLFFFFFCVWYSDPPNSNFRHWAMSPPLPHSKSETEGFYILFLFLFLLFYEQLHQPIHRTHKTHWQACLHVPFLPHPAEHVKHICLGVFMCSLPPSPCPSPRTRRVRPSGCAFCVHLLPYHSNTKDTPRRACLHVSISTQWGGHAPLLIVSLFQFWHGENGYTPPRRVVISMWQLARRGLSLLVVLCIFKTMR